MKNNIEENYLNIDEDFKFLNNIMNNKIKRYIICNIEPKYFSDSGPNKATITYDDTLEISTKELTKDIVETISEKYLNFLTKKYFKNLEKLIEYISEFVYGEISKYIINRNIEANTYFRNKQEFAEILAANKQNN